MTGRSHLSIGEVLSLLQEEFPDVTISKIRFLESQGLVDPERTPSGYRKFYEPDIDRLRWVLRQQRDSFLPLKVIRGRLADGPEPADGQEVLTGFGAAGLGPDDGPPTGVRPVEVAVAVHEVAVHELVIEEQMEAAGPGAALEADGDLVPPAGNGRAGNGNGAGRRRPRAEATSAGAPGKGAAAKGAAAKGAAAESGPAETGPAESGPDGGPAPRRRPLAPRAERSEEAALGAGTPGSLFSDEAPPQDFGRRTASAARRHPSQAGLRPAPVGPVVGGPGEEELSLDELVHRAGVDVETVRDLERFGLVSAKLIAGTPYYGADAAVIARLAGAFARHGVEARHLRAYKGAAEREAGLVQQVIMPLIRQRNPEARQTAMDTAQELSDLGGELRAALLRSALSDLR